MHGELESFKAGATRSSCRSMKRMGESSSPIAARNDSRMELVVCLSTILFARGPWSPHKEKRYGVDGFKNRPSVQVGARINYPCEARECMDGPHVMERVRPPLPHGMTVEWSWSSVFPPSSLRGVLGPPTRRNATELTDSRTGLLSRSVRGLTTLVKHGSVWMGLMSWRCVGRFYFFPTQVREHH
ncbi:MAG: hypothetical protein J3R72DRAFT_126456 [Linnemannia gamsii]|nr:MAG: hypothetical protein J3R72DRAFT_126456 [Linnemannia gamsii]